MGKKAKAGLPATQAATSAPVPTPNQDEERERQARLIQTALNSPIPKFYANSFGLAQSSSDLSLVLLLNNQPVGTINMSYITAKSLVHDLNGLINSIEKAAKQEIQTIGQMTEHLQKVKGARKPIKFDA